MRRKQKVKRDIILIAISIIVGLVLYQSDFVAKFLLKSTELEYLAVFVAGLFFTSVFTTAPATVTLAELSFVVPTPELMVIGAFGALCGDAVIFSFFRDDIMEDVNYLLGVKRWRRLPHIFRTRMFKRFLTLIGGLVIASPLPDELGLAIMGFNKTNNFTFAVVSFACNALGILAIALVAAALVRAV